MTKGQKETLPICTLMEVRREMLSSFIRRAAMPGLVFTLAAALAAAPAVAQRSQPGSGGLGTGGGDNNPRIPAGEVLITGTVTALGTGGATVQITTDHGTAVTLTTNTSTQVRPNGSITTLSNLALGQRIEALYKPADKIALALVAAAVPTGSVTGAITTLDLTGGMIQITPLAGSPQTVKLTAQTEFSLNGQEVTPDDLVVGDLATLRLASDGSANRVAAETPPIIPALAGTITMLDATGNTLEVTTQSATAITLKLIPATTIQLNGVTATAGMLAVGDTVTVKYDYRLLPGASRALAIAAKSAATTPGTTTPTPSTSVAVASVTLNPTSVKGGTSSTGTVTLAAAAPSSGAMVTLASSNPTAASVPGSVTVPAGATSVTFTVTTTTVTANTTVALFASSGGATSMATLTVTP